MKIKDRLKKFSRLLARHVAALVLGTSLAVTGLLVYSAVRGNSALNQKNFELYTQGFEQKVLHRLENYEQLLIALRGLYMGSVHVTFGEFSAFAEELDFRRRYPGIQALAFLPRVLADDSAAFYKQVQREEVLSHFSIWPETGAREYFPVLYIKPYSAPNQRIVGFDISSEPRRRKALEQARDTNRVAYTESVALKQESRQRDGLKGFIMALPIYKRGTSTATVEDRRRNLIGYFSCAFRASDFFASIFSNHPGSGGNLRFSVFDGHDSDTSQPIYRLPATAAFASTPMDYAHTGYLDLNGQAWKYRLEADKDFVGRARNTVPFIIALAGLVVSMLLYWLILTTRRHADFEKENSISLTEAIKSRDNLMSICSHELRSPLTSMKLQSQMLSRRLQSNGDGALNVEKLGTLAADWGHQLDRLNNLIEEMLDFARITAGKLRMTLAECDLGELITKIADRMREQAANQQCSLTTELEPGVKGNWDCIRLEQVITNLIENAIKYGNGSPILVALRREGDEAVVAVSDFGFGIPADLHEAIFQPYERAASTEKISGLGLGLYIARQVVRAHNGNIHVESRAGQGSTFIVRLPILRADMTADSTHHVQIT